MFLSVVTLLQKLFLKYIIFLMSVLVSTRIVRFFWIYVFIMVTSELKVNRTFLPSVMRSHHVMVWVNSKLTYNKSYKHLF